jgi:Cdc6-like AAA superfamily ATPase
MDAVGFASQGEGGPADVGAASQETRVETKQLVDFWCERYLDAYIAPGGSKIKFITGNPGSGKSAYLRMFMSEADERLFKTASISAKNVWMHDFKEIYAAILDKADLQDCLRICAQYVVTQMGYDFDDIPQDKSFADYLTDKGLFDPLARLELRTQVGALFFRNHRIDKNFAVCAALLTGGFLGHPVLESASKELLLAWLSGDKSVRIPSLRKLGLSPFKITKYNARHMLRSAIEIMRLAGYAGLAVTVDDLDALIGNNFSPEKLRYTKIRREDAYESIRELIDEIDTLNHVMFVFAFDKELLEGEATGLKSYQALWMRIQNEIESRRFNRFSDIIDADRLQ